MKLVDRGRIPGENATEKSTVVSSAVVPFAPPDVSFACSTSSRGKRSEQLRSDDGKTPPPSSRHASFFQFHTAGEEFLVKHRNASLDIESMIELHEKFLTALAIGALLQPKQQAIRDQLLKLFEIVAVFARRWQLGFDSIRLEHIQKLQHEFQQSKQFISTVLKPFLPRLIDSPLRALACALQDDLPLT